MTAGSGWMWSSETCVIRGQACSMCRTMVGRVVAKGSARMVDQQVLRIGKIHTSNKLGGVEDLFQIEFQQSWMF